MSLARLHCYISYAVNSNEQGKAAYENILARMTGVRVSGFYPCRSLQPESVAALVPRLSGSNTFGLQRPRVATMVP